jgi:hypothetical protein
MLEFSVKFFKSILLGRGEYVRHFDVKIDIVPISLQERIGSRGSFVAYEAWA